MNFRVWGRGGGGGGGGGGERRDIRFDVGYPEIGECDVSVVGDEDVVRFDISVHDSEAVQRPDC